MEKLTTPSLKNAYNKAYEGEKTANLPFRKFKYGNSEFKQDKYSHLFENQKTRGCNPAIWNERQDEIKKISHKLFQSLKEIICQS
ncbi:MAG: hypothetical protein M0C28_39690 [Candidatus Moduliflexus flocculans]|nr:hypothetical protein [Candidatus Moduliflexus flocculans]